MQLSQKQKIFVICSWVALAALAFTKIHHHSNYPPCADYEKKVNARVEAEYKYGVELLTSRNYELAYSEFGRALVHIKMIGKENYKDARAMKEESAKHLSQEHISKINKGALWADEFTDCEACAEPNVTCDIHT